MFISLKKEDIGKSLTTIVRVENIHQTTGPTIFLLNDGTGKLVAKAFLKPGARAFPAIEKGDIAEITLRLQEYDNRIEGSIDAIEKRDPELFDKAVETNRAKQLQIESIPFLVKSEHLEKLRERFEKAAMLIKKSIIENRPIFVRHNADCDGYSGAVALERCILPIIRDQQRDSFQEWRFFRRLPTRAPFYSLGDVMSDIVGMTNDMLRSNTVPPLIIVVDNGSGKEDLVALKSLKIYGCPIVIVDHHFISTDVISPIVDVHINPYLIGHNSSITAGMLATELGRFVNKKAAVSVLPALSGIGDKSQGDEMQQYLKIAENEGYTHDDLKKIALCIDFAAYYLRSMEGRVLVDDMLGANKERQKQLVTLWHDEAQRRMHEQLQVIQRYTTIEESEKAVIATIHLDNIVSGDFPSYGKVTGMTNEWLKSLHSKPVFVLGIAKDMLIIRTTHPQFNLNGMIAAIPSRHWAVSGGGHERAGTLHYAPVAQNEVLSFVRQWIEKVLSQ